MEEKKADKKAIFRLTPEQIAAIEYVVNKGDTAEVKPSEDGAGKILHAKRHIVKTGQKTDCPKC